MQTENQLCNGEDCFVFHCHISVLTAGGALAAAVSLKFNLKDKTQELNSAICKLERIRKNIDYIIACNGDFTEKEFKEIVANC